MTWRGLRNVWRLGAVGDEKASANECADERIAGPREITGDERKSEEGRLSARELERLCDGMGESEESW